MHLAASNGIAQKKTSIWLVSGTRIFRTSINNKKIFQVIPFAPITVLPHPTLQQFSLYLALNTCLKCQGRHHTGVPPSVSRTLNRLRLDTDYWCYVHSRHVCAISVGNYLLLCIYNLWPWITFTGRIHEKRLGSHPLGTRWLKEMRQHPLIATCSHTGHINPSATTISIPQRKSLLFITGSF